ncbi:glutamate racemase [Aliiglaciecola lipolytica]|uniref:glutamate racemase n=1 Tax=Aliiglaciecola lipolytica TaxID=477689 RepID=UPI001376315E|nr:glutamate racemase [Aliiglaciecola lipolytica]
MSHQNNAAIGIFDSGIGGISVAAAIRKMMPEENILYVADSANAPYGGKSEQFVLQRCQRIVEFLIQQKVKLIVVACNTATLICISKLRALYPIQFIGVEPGIKPALLASQSGVVGVLATQNTVNSLQYRQLVSRLSQQSRVLSQACNGLVDRIEAGEIESTSTQLLIKQFVTPLIDQGADQIVLGCTHYGFVSRQIHEIVKDRASLVNTSDAIARQTLAVLNREGLKSTDTQQGETVLFSNQANPNSLNIVEHLWPNEVEVIHPFPVD